MEGDKKASSSDTTLAEQKSTSQEVHVVTYYRHFPVTFKWTIRDWARSPEYVRNKAENVETRISSPIFTSDNGSTWQLNVVFLAKEPHDKQTLCFKCYCLKKLPYDAAKECPEVQGTLKLADGDGKHMVCYTLIDGCKISNSPAFDTEAKEAVNMPDQMNLVANLQIVGLEGVTEPPQPKAPTKVPDSALNRFLTLVASDEEFADLTIEVEDQKFLAHRIILASRSPVLKALLSADMKEKRESKIVLCDVTPSAWRLFQRFLYTNVFAPSEACEMPLLLEVLMLSDKYDVAPLKNKVEADITSIMSSDNVLEIFDTAQKFDLLDLKQAASEFIRKNWACMKSEKKLMTWLSAGSDLAMSLFEKLHF